MSPNDPYRERIARTAELVGRLHEIIAELEELHPGRKFPLDGHLVGSLAEAAAEAMFDITLKPPSTPGHDAVVNADRQPVEIKGTYGNSGVALRMTSHAAAVSLIVLRLSRQSGEDHEVVYNGPLILAATAAGPPGSNGQARIGLNRLRSLNAQVPEDDRVPVRLSNGDTTV
ncbi:hypothetical protein [Mycobacterium sp. E787]|uniref:DUF6998 domain-containing protein n=1 Tax=Mycobacterium sp. E787 TaxID=1834150 RepID=UPI001E2C0E88|nr:hypothetical protein [Mycobacterium sp. E787]